MQLSARQKYWIPKTMAVVGYIGYVTLSVDSHPLALAVLVGVLLLTDVVFKKIKPVEVAAGLAFGFLLVLAELEVIPYSVAGLIAAAVFIHVGGALFLAAVRSIILQWEDARPTRISEGLWSVVMLIIGWTIIFKLVYG
jgi:hypothetical protein